MKKHNLSEDLKELINATDPLCVSLIIPQNEIPSKRKLDRIAIEHAIAKLDSLLRQGYDPSVVNEFTGKLKNIGDDLTRIEGVKGMGIFISKSIFKVITFPFEVKEKIYAGSTFEIRDVL